MSTFGELGFRAGDTVRQVGGPRWPYTQEYYVLISGPYGPMCVDPENDERNGNCSEWELVSKYEKPKKGYAAFANQVLDAKAVR